MKILIEKKYSKLIENGVLWFIYCYRISHGKLNNNQTSIQILNVNINIDKHFIN